MENLGLFEGSPKQVLPKEQALALFRQNQQGRTLTRVPGGQFECMAKKPDLSRGDEMGDANPQTLDV